MTQDEKNVEALEEIAGMQHFHEGRGGCHGACPICVAVCTLGMDRYLRKPGDVERLRALQIKHDLPHF